MAKNVFNTNKPAAQVSMNAFDNGQFQTYSTKAGIGLPCFYLHVTPKMKARINVQNYLVAENLRQNAFLRAKQNIDFFFVPYRQLNHMFSPLYYGRNDNQHVFQLNQDIEVPSFSLNNVTNGLLNMYVLTRMCQHLLKLQFDFLTSKWLGEMGWNTYDDFIERFYHGLTTYAVSLPLPAWTDFVDNMQSLYIEFSDYLYFDYNHFYDTDDEFAEAEGVDDDVLFARYICYGNSTVEDCLRTLDMLGYGNDYSIFKDKCDLILNRIAIESDQPDFDTWCKEIFATTSPEPNPYDEKNIVNNFFICLNAVLSSLSDYQYDSYCQVNAFALMAYQKIFDNVYRNNVVVPRFKFGDDLVRSFNSDGLSSQDLDDFYHFGRFCALFLCPWYIQNRRNLTNGFWNDAQFGDVSKVVTENDYQQYNEVTIPDLRMSFAMQTFRERLLRCGDREKDLLKGLFGTKSRYVGDEYVYYIGSYDGVFNVNTVQDVSGDNLGRLGGNIISSVDGRTLNFEAEDFGVIIGIHSILPTMVYPAFGIDPQNSKFEQFDFYHPDFENLGLQPVLRWHYLFPFADLIEKENTVVGYSARFLEYKQKLDVSHGTFCDSYREPSAGVYDVNRGIDSDYVTNFNLVKVGTPASQYVSPDSLDNIFDTLTDYSIESDHFKTWLNVQCDTLNPMSVLGLPQLA